MSDHVTTVAIMALVSSASFGFFSFFSFSRRTRDSLSCQPLAVLLCRLRPVAMSSITFLYSDIPMSVIRKYIIGAYTVP